MNQSDNKLVNDVLFDIIKDYIDNTEKGFGCAIVQDNDLKDLLLDFWVNLLQDKDIKDTVIVDNYEFKDDIYEDPYDHLTDNNFYKTLEFLASEMKLPDDDNNWKFTYIIGLQWRVYKGSDSSVVSITEYLRLDKTLKENILHILKNRIDDIEDTINTLTNKKNNYKNIMEKYVR